MPSQDALSTLDVLSLVIALYGALLATALGVREWLRERRKIRVFLEHVAWYERVQLTVTNTGHRMITIVGIALAIGSSQGGETFYEEVRRGDIFSPELEHDPFPFTLADGEHKTLPFSEVVSNYLIEGNMAAKLTLYDAEGTEYTDFQTRTYDAKWGGYLKL